MAEFRMSRTLKDKVTNVLTRRGIPFEILEKDGELRCKVDISGEKFHKIVLRAKMEKIQEEKNSRISYVAKVELEDSLVRSEVGTAFYVED